MERDWNKEPAQNIGEILAQLQGLPGRASGQMSAGLTNPANITDPKASMGMAPAWIALMNQLLLSSAKPESGIGSLIEGGK